MRVVEGYPTDTARRILKDHFPEWRDLFLEKNAGYGEMHQVLGPRAQFVDMHRKFGKIQRAIWEGQDIGGETPKEVLLDLIGHCFLMYDLLDQEESQ